MIARRHLVLSLKLMLVVASLALSPGKAGAGRPESGNVRFVIRNVRLFDGEAVSDHRSVLVENGRIARLGGPELKAPGAEVVDGRGRIRPGLRADLVLVEGDPTQDILATRNIVAIWKRGVRGKR